MKKIPVTESVGMVLGHDLTRIVPGEFKGAAFKKGHVIRQEDVPELLKMGKDHIYIWDPPPGHIHENEAASRIARVLAGSGVSYGQPGEGKVSFTSAGKGLLRVNREGINRINGIENMCVSTLHDFRRVEAGKVIAATRVIPLTIAEEAVAGVEDLSNRYGWFIRVKPFKPLRAGAIITGNEVFYGRIKDGFGPVLKRKMEEFGNRLEDQVYLPDETDGIAASIKDMHERGMDLIMVAGGMSVDPDDNTTGAIRAAGAREITYGSPVLPGAMFMVAELGSTVVLGLPACVMYSRATVLDIVLPRIMAGERIAREDIAGLGVGGMCENCGECRFPNCGFGRC